MYYVVRGIHSVHYPLAITRYTLLYMFFQPQNHNQNERGVIALLIVLTSMFIVAGIALSAVFVFLNQIQATRNIGYSYESMYAAEAGAEDMLLRYFDIAKFTPSFYPYILAVGDATASTTVSENIFVDVTITSEGDKQDRIRRMQVFARLALGIFSFAAQAGVGGVNMDSNARVIGDIYSNANVTGAANTEVVGDVRAVGTISSPDPEISGIREEGADVRDLPQVDVAYWTAQANINSNPITGDVTYAGLGNTEGPRKIIGNVTVGSGADLTVMGPLHITGNFTLDSNSDLYVSESFVASSTVIVVEGEIRFHSNSDVHATTATPRGFMLLMSTSTSASAIYLNSNQGIEGAIFAPNGTIHIASRGEVISLAAKAMQLDSNAEIEYDTGLRDIDFGGSEAYQAQVISWGEQ